MALARTPLDPATLSDAAKKALAGAGPMKMMAARGLAPLPRPADVAIVLYQLSLDADEVVKAAAEKTAGELPEKVLSGALADATLDPRVLDFFGARVVGKPDIAQIVLLNKSTADETVREMTAKLGERELEMVAQNEQRLLRHPAIIAAMYLNPKCRMSTVDRAVELAVRNNVVVDGIPAWEDVVAALMGVRTKLSLAELAATDAAFAQITSYAVGDAPVDDVVLDELLQEDEAGNPVSTTEQTEAKVEKIGKLSVAQKIRLATLGNAFARATLIRDTSKQVAMAAIKSPGVSESEAAKYSANRALSDDVIRYISQKKDWTRIYKIKHNLVLNPKCPVATSMRLLPFLHPKDLKNLAKSKGIPSALAAQAKKLSSQKSGG